MSSFQLRASPNWPPAQSLKTELLQQEISRINSGGIANGLKASKSTSKRVTRPRSRHLTRNVTDEIKKLASVKPPAAGTWGTRINCLVRVVSLLTCRRVAKL